MNFIASYKPSLKLGTYCVKVTQSIKLDGAKKESFESIQKIAITGDRFTVNPHNVHMLYPADNSIHNFSNTLAHITMNNECYPWERKVSSDQEEAPYLALLLFHEDEAFETNIMNLKTLQTKIGLPDKQLEVSDNLEDKVTVIEVNKTLLQKMIPNTNELKLLTHVQETDCKRSVVIANRLPFKGGTSTACLVSLENRFKGDKFNYDAEGDIVTLVLLKQWSFTDIKFYSRQKIDTNHTEIDENVIKKIKKRTYRGKATFIEMLEKELSEEQFNRYKDALLIESMDNSPVFLRLLSELHVKNFAIPTTKDSEANVFLEKAMVPLPHYLRTGDKTVSWYRGPLLGGEQKNDYKEISFPVKVADELLFFDETYQMFDVSYASAWELGKLLCLKNISVASELLRMKKRHALNLLKQKNKQDNELLPIQKEAYTTDASETLKKWFKELTQLEHIPFNYLLADERLLQEESLHFFVVDKFWIRCLIEGALEVGGEIPNILDSLRETSSYSGILLRSEIQLIWSDLEVVSAGKEPIKTDRLSADTVLYLFEGVINEVEIKQAKQALHFEMMPSDASFRDKRLVDICTVANGKNAAEFATSCVAKRRGMKFLKGGE